MRIVPTSSAILEPSRTTRTRVGLVGAAVSDHPQIARDRRGPRRRRAARSACRRCAPTASTTRFVGRCSARGGYRTLTTAGDGASQRLRDLIKRKARERHLLRPARAGPRRTACKRLKLYMMVGVPGETDDDIDELVEFARELARDPSAGQPRHRAVRRQAQHAARRQPFAGIDVVEARLTRLRRGCGGRGGKVEVRATSARWAWVEYVLAQGDARAGLAAFDAYRAGGCFGAYRDAFAARGAAPTGPRARVPSTRELIALRRRAIAARA